MRKIIVDKISNEIINIVKKKYGKKKNYPLYLPKFYKDTFADANRVIRSTWVSSKGNEVQRFEKKISSLVKSKYVLATNSGTSALHLAFLAINSSSNDEIIMPSLNFVANANSVLYCGANPVFIDCELNNFGISANKIESFIKTKCKKIGRFYVNKKTKRTIKAVVAVHIFGNPCDIINIKKICNKYNLILIEDAAECVGSKYKKKHLGTFGDFGILSFNGNKIVTTGSGGAVITKKKSYYELINNYLNLNKSSSIEEKFNGIGYNYKMTALNASIGISQLKRINIILKKKREIFHFYKKKFISSKFIKINEIEDQNQTNNWLVSIELKNNYISYRNEILKKLKLKNFFCRAIWKPLHMLNHLRKYQREDLKNTNKVFKKIICLPSSLE
jgi:perosamine synthetase